MCEWERADWYYIKRMYIRHIGIEIEGKLYLIDLMPFFTGLLSFPQIRRWQRLPVYQPKDDESQQAMRKLKFSKATVEKGIKRDGYASAFGTSVFVGLGPWVIPWFKRHINMAIIPGIPGIIIAILGYLVFYFLVNSLFFSYLIRREIQTYEPAPFRISIRYKQKFSEKLPTLGLLLFAIILFPAVYDGFVEPLAISVLAMFFAAFAHMIPPKTEIWYKIRPRE